MIVVSVHLMSAVTKEMTTLGRMKICNDDTGDSKHRNYDGQIKRKPDFHQVTRIGRLENHNAQALTIWHLVARMLKGMGYAGTGAALDAVDEERALAWAKHVNHQEDAFLAGARWQAAQMIINPEGDDV